MNDAWSNGLETAKEELERIDAHAEEATIAVEQSLAGQAPPWLGEAMRLANTRTIIAQLNEVKTRIASLEKTNKQMQDRVDQVARWATDVQRRLKRLEANQTTITESKKNG